MADASQSRDTLDTRLANLGITVLERGWLSANSIVMNADAGNLVVDTGYATHADQTVTLIRQALKERPLERIVNTHLHSDHCGGNAALRSAWPAVRISIPPGQAAAVRDWDPVALSYVPTGQFCPRFGYEDLIRPGDQLCVGRLAWVAHAAPGHDPHAIVLHEPDQRILISGDALWNNGFGVVFPELDGANAFAEVADTLDLIEALAPSTVIPGHGPVFQGTEVTAAIARARSRLLQFQRNPAKHRRHALKVLIKFKMLELQRIEHEALQAWFSGSDYFIRIAQIDHSQLPSEVLNSLLKELGQSQALAIRGGWIFNQ